MSKRDIVVIGASAGGVEALIHFCGLIPPKLPAAVFIVLHTAPSAPGLLPKILSRYSSLPTVFPQNGERIQLCKIYIAPPDLHLIIHPDKIELSSGPRENLVRPSVDTLFRSAAFAFGPRVIGVVLSGTRSDGTGGLQEIQRHGGVTMVQDPQEALFSGMPENVLRNLSPDYVLPLDQIVSTIMRLTYESIEMEKLENPMQHNASQKENKLIQQSKSHFEKDVNESQQTILTCPECGGVLWEVNDGAEMHYACHVGHRYSEGSLLVGKAKALEDALWVAVRSLEERASLSRRLANRAKITGKELVYEQCLDQAEEAERSANIVRSIILNGKVTSAEKQQNPLEE